MEKDLSTPQPLDLSKKSTIIEDITDIVLDKELIVAAKILLDLRNGQGSSAKKSARIYTKDEVEAAKALMILKSNQKNVTIQK
ncbi:hypothetical protein DMENIID0001_148960 [Sergentomyia squamirostris]